MADSIELLPLDLGAVTRLAPKGKLKIFPGASPGVGKTFAMLQAGAERLREGMDVIVGLAETHNRKETEERLINLEVLSRKDFVYRGKTFKEPDLDGILSRAPRLVLIDECARSNLPGSRHPKRYKDIEEILDYGIDVYTTLNIQHIESLKDAVEQMTHITVRESVPDSFFKSADEAQLVDLPPDDLLQRLAEGKVYVPNQAKDAIEHFFSRSNLLSLRELALRHAITVVDDKMSDYNQEQLLHHLYYQLYSFIRVSVVGSRDSPGPVIKYVDQKPVRLKKIDANAIQWALAHQRRSGRTTETFSDASYLYLPIKVGNNSLGVIGLWPLKDPLTMDDSRIAQILVNQTALAIERLNYVNEQNKQ